ncbi:MAG: hypothetical protein NDI60_09740 [Elusimicrobiales bacterium]|nr:hypothetical protein [Elusimicrobiales bacterium]
MKTLAIALLLLSGAAAAQDCPKSADACSGAKKNLSPFLAASAQAQPEAKPAAAPGKAAPAAKAAAAPALSTAAASPVPASPAPAKTSSSPLWLAFVGAALAGLYFYLGAGTGKGKKR